MKNKADDYSLKRLEVEMNFFKIVSPVLFLISTFKSGVTQLSLSILSGCYLVTYAILQGVFYIVRELKSKS